MVCGPIQVFPMLFIFEKLYSVSPFMCWKGTGITEAFPKFCNFIWFLSSGHCRMSSKCCVINEGFPTCLTVTRFLSNEFCHVFVRNEALSKLHHTVYFQFLSSEIACMFLKITKTTKCFTLFTYLWFFSSLNYFVLLRNNCDLSMEAFPHSLRSGFLSRVSAFVSS